MYVVLESMHLQMVVEFAVADELHLSRTLYILFNNGHISDGLIGYLPVDLHDKSNQDDDQQRLYVDKQVYHPIRQEGLEN
jgi:hypothetical protein